MGVARMGRRLRSGIAAIGISAVLAAGCGSPQEAANGGAPADETPYKVGLIYSQSGPLATYGAQYAQGFKAGLAYATNGTNKVGTHPVDVTEVDDAGDPAKAVSAAKDLVGKG